MKFEIEVNDGRQAFALLQTLRAAPEGNVAHKLADAITEFFIDSYEGKIAIEVAEQAIPPTICHWSKQVDLLSMNSSQACQRLKEF